MNLFLLRHGQSHGNATGDYSMLDLDPLSETGQKQAEQAAEALTGVSFEKIVVSPLLRATQTVFPYLEKTGRKAEIWPEIAEVRWKGTGEAAADSWPSEPSRIPDEMGHRFTFAAGRRCQPSVDESFGQGLRRVLQAAERLRTLHAARCPSLLMVTHGYFLREFLNVFLRTENRIFFDHRNVRMSRLMISDEKIHLNGLNLPIEDSSV